MQHTATSLAATFAVAAAFAVTGCSAHSESPTSAPATAAAPTTTTKAAMSPSASFSHATTLSKTEAAATYLRIVAPVNAAQDRMATQLASLPDSATGADVAKITDPVADAIDRADEQLLRVNWPTDIVPDVKALVSAAAIVANDLRAVDGQNILSISQWETQIATDAGKLNGAVAILRSDLGLPPATTPTA